MELKTTNSKSENIIENILNNEQLSSWRLSSKTNLIDMLSCEKDNMITHKTRSTITFTSLIKMELNQSESKSFFINKIINLWEILRRIISITQTFIFPLGVNGTLGDENEIHQISLINIYILITSWHYNKKFFCNSRI